MRNARQRSSLAWMILVIAFLLPFLVEKLEQARGSAKRSAHPEYFSHIDQFGDPITLNEVISYLCRAGYQDLDPSFVKGPYLIPEGWLLGLVFKSEKNPNDQFYWFLKVGKSGFQDIKMYPGNRYPIPAYP